MLLEEGPAQVGDEPVLSLHQVSLLEATSRGHQHSQCSQLSTASCSSPSSRAAAGPLSSATGSQ